MGLPMGRRPGFPEEGFQRAGRGGTEPQSDAAGRDGCSPGPPSERGRGRGSSWTLGQGEGREKDEGPGEEGARGKESRCLEATVTVAGSPEMRAPGHPWASVRGREGAVAAGSKPARVQQVPFRPVGWSSVSGLEQTDVGIISHQALRCQVQGRWPWILAPSSFQHQTKSMHSPPGTPCASQPTVLGRDPT